VLLDHFAWAKRNNRSYDPFSGYAIPVSELKEVAKDQGVEFKVGDILLIRSGYIQGYYKLQSENPAKLKDLGENPSFAGVEQSEELKAFLHDS
jgi:hypothetical protein